MLTQSKDGTKDDKLINQSVIVDWTFDKEYTFSYLITTTNVVTLRYVSGNEYWVDESVRS